MKIYTKTGDDGSTGLYGGTRVPKYHIRIEAYGTVDELNSYIGLLRDQKITSKYKGILIQIQNDLFALGAMLATPPDKEKLNSGKDRLNIEYINSESISVLETQIDIMNELLPKMTHFILPGGHTAVSHCHIARAICRRAERITTQLHENESINPDALSYLNRLSDYLFVLARMLTYENELVEIPWNPDKKT